MGSLPSSQSYSLFAWQNNSSGHSNQTKTKIRPRVQIIMEITAVSVK